MIRFVFFGKAESKYIRNDLRLPRVWKCQFEEADLTWELIFLRTNSWVLKFKRVSRSGFCLVIPGYRSESFQSFSDTSWVLRLLPTSMFVWLREAVENEWLYCTMQQYSMAKETAGAKLWIFLIYFDSGSSPSLGRNWSRFISFGQPWSILN